MRNKKDFRVLFYMCSAGKFFMLQVQSYNPNTSYPKPERQTRNAEPSFGWKDYDTVQQENQGYEKTAIFAGLLQLFSSSLNKISQWLGNRLSSGKEFTSAENVQRVADDIIKNNKLGVTVEYISPENLTKMQFKYGPEGLAEVAAGRNAFYSDAQKLAVAPKSKPSLLPHELGHAVNAKSKFWSALQKSRQYSAFAPVAALILSKINTNKDGSPNFVERNAGLLGFCAFLPTIIEEGKASLRGINQAKKTLAKEIQLGKVSLKALKRNYLTAWLTYVVAGLGLGVATKFAVLEDRFNTGEKI